jgi:hypothetical protein
MSPQIKYKNDCAVSLEEPRIRRIRRINKPPGGLINSEAVKNSLSSAMPLACKNSFRSALPLACKNSRFLKTLRSNKLHAVQKTISKNPKS